MPPVGNEEASGSPWMSSLPENSAIATPSPVGLKKESCFSAVEPVRGWNQCVKWVAPFSIAHSFIAEATASARIGSSGRPSSSVSWRRLNSSEGTRWRWTDGEKTLAPKIWLAGSVRSGAPSAPPLGLHCAAVTFCVRVLGMRATLDTPRARAIVHVDKHRRSAFATGRECSSLRANRPEGETAPAMFRPVSKDPRPLPADTPPRSLSTEEVVVLRRSWLVRGSLLGLVAALVMPAVASADTLDAAQAGKLPDSVAINSLWVIVAGVLVMFMQAGFAFLEIGFSRGKNAGTVVAKILANFSIAAILYWAVGFAFAFGNGKILGTHGFFLRDYGDPQKAFAIMGLSDATIESKWFFQFVFCAVSLAIVWGTTLERIKFGVYIIYAIVFSALIYPIASHWVFGGGWLQSSLGMQDFAGSTAVHLIGATGALAVLLLLGPRRGKYGKDGKPRAIPGHNMPLFGLGVLILWLGWFGFNPGSTLNALDGRFPEILLVTQLAAAAGVLGALIVARWKTGSIDIGMAGNGAIAALVAITAPSGYVDLWTAPIIGGVAGLGVPLCIYAIDKRIDDPVGALSAHGIAGIWGTISCGIFTAPQLAKYNAVGDPGLIYTGSFHQILVQALGVVTVFAFVFVLSYGTFWAIKKTYGLRVSAEEEDAGLDISEHGMYGYPEQFIPAPELVGYAVPPGGSRDIPRRAPAHQEVPET